MTGIFSQKPTANSQPPKTMERERELTKLVNVLRQTARTAQQAAWTGGTADAAAHCIEQYNRVLARLKEIDPSVDNLYQPLQQGSSLTVVAIACRQLAAYYADEVGGAPGGAPGWMPGPGHAFDPEAFKEFWRKSASDIEDFGEFIRENLDAWLGRPRRRGESGKPDDGGTQDSEKGPSSGPV